MNPPQPAAPCLYKGQAVREVRTGRKWYVTGVYHPERGASITVQQNPLKAFQNGRRSYASEHVFRREEVEAIGERGGEG